MPTLGLFSSMVLRTCYVKGQYASLRSGKCTVFRTLIPSATTYYPKSALVQIIESKLLVTNLGTAVVTGQHDNVVFSHDEYLLFGTLAEAYFGLRRERGMESINSRKETGEIAFGFDLCFLLTITTCCPAPRRYSFPHHAEIGVRAGAPAAGACCLMAGSAQGGTGD